MKFRVQDDERAGRTNQLEEVQAALQLAEAIDRVAAIARDSGFPSVGLMLEMARDLARSEHAKAEEKAQEQSAER